MITASKIPLTVAKAVLRELLALPADTAFESVRAIYEKHGITGAEYVEGVSPLYNRFTSHIDRRHIENMNVGDKWGGYYSDKSGKVMTWTGKPIGRIIGISRYASGGFAPCKRASITFQLRGKVFRGICSYSTMECFTFKRIK